MQQVLVESTGTNNEGFQLCWIEKI